MSPTSSTSHARTSFGRPKTFMQKEKKSIQEQLPPKQPKSSASAMEKI